MRDMIEPTSLRLRDDALASLRREALSLGLFALAASATAVLALFSRTRSLHDLVVAALLIALGGAVALAIDWRRRRQTFGSWEGTLGRDAVAVTTAFGTQTLRRAGLESIVATVWPARGLVLRGEGDRPLFLPAAIERFDDVRAELATWRPIEASRVPALVARAWPIVIVAICALEALAIGATGRATIASASLLLALAVSWSLSNALRSRRLSVRARALSLLLLAPVIYLVVHAWRALH